MRALFDLAQHYGEGPIQSQDIHRRQGIDENYLNQILISLRKAGLIESIRGPQGGHRLARPPMEITVLEALTALEGPLFPTDGSTSTAMTVDREIVREVWCDMRQVLEAHLSHLTLEDLCQRKRQRTGAIMYHI